MNIGTYDGASEFALPECEKVYIGTTFHSL
jgi:hypothetical protein